jgi:hypothetical protein
VPARRHRRHRRLLGLAAAVSVLGGALAGCGDSDEPEQNPDEITFCRLALVNEPVAEADAPVWRRLDELSPDDIDDSVTVLREAAEELEEFTPGSPESIAAEFEVRFRDDYLAARTEVEAFLADECQEYVTTTTRPATTNGTKIDRPDEPDDATDTGDDTIDEDQGDQP